MTTKTKKAAPAAAKPQAGTLDRMVETDRINKGLGPSTNGAVAAKLNGSEPRPVPGDKKFDWQAEYPDERVFVYTTPKDQKTNMGVPMGGVTIGLAAISEKRQPSVGFLRRVRVKPEFDQVLDMIELVASDAALGLLDVWRPTDLQNMFEEWSEWSNTSAGES